MLKFLVLLVVLAGASWFSYVTDPSTAHRTQVAHQMEKEFQNLHRALTELKQTVASANQ